MDCIRCHKKAVVSIKGNPAFCEKCFCDAIEKRIRKHVRMNKLFSKNDKIYTEGELCKYLVRDIIKDLPVKYTSKKQANKIVLAYTANDLCIDFLKYLTENKSLISKTKEVKLLATITNEEAKLFAKFKKLEFKPLKKEPNLNKFLSNLSEKNPEIINSLGKSAKEIIDL